MTRDEMERLLENFRYRESFRDEMLVVVAKRILRKVVEKGEELSDDLITGTTSAIRFDGKLKSSHLVYIKCLMRIVDDGLIDKLTMIKEMQEAGQVTMIQFNATRKGFDEAIKIMSEDAYKHRQRTSKMA